MTMTMMMMMMMQAECNGAVGGAQNSEIQGRKANTSWQRLVTHLQCPTEMGQLLLLMLSIALTSCLIIAGEFLGCCESGSSKPFPLCLSLQSISTGHWALLCCNLGQVVHTCVSLSPSSIIWYWSKGDDG